MFCKICGKELAEGSLFCINCGAKIEQSSQPIENGVSQVSQPTESEYSGEAAASIPAQPAESIPQPANPVTASVSYGNIDPPIRPAERQNFGSGSYDFTVTNEPKGDLYVNSPEKPEKYYTFGHLALCLAAVAVMAIVAGVFAGLYFSAIA